MKYRCSEKKIEYFRSEHGLKVQRRKDRKRYKDPRRKIKIYARNYVRYRVKKGIIPHISEQKCEVCGAQAHEYHHDNYHRDNWVQVRPMCRHCHVDWHKHNEPVMPENLTH